MVKWNCMCYIIYEKWIFLQNNIPIYRPIDHNYEVYSFVIVYILFELKYVINNFSFMATHHECSTNHT